MASVVDLRLVWPPVTISGSGWQTTKSSTECSPWWWADDGELCGAIVPAEIPWRSLSTWHFWSTASSWKTESCGSVTPAETPCIGCLREDWASCPNSVSSSWWWGDLVIRYCDGSTASLNGYPVPIWSLAFLWHSWSPASWYGVSVHCVRGIKLVCIMTLLQGCVRHDAESSWKLVPPAETPPGTPSIGCSRWVRSSTGVLVCSEPKVSCLVNSCCARKAPSR